jgi:arylsulfatase A-like enzyme
VFRLFRLLGACLGAAALAAPRPNIVIVLVDDAGYGDFSCHGHPFLRTPHIDRLHAGSVRLTDFHVAPMCSPTRGQLLTGCHGLRTGVTSVTAGRTFLRPEFPTAAQMFAQAGYATGLFGKWHLGDSFPHRPIDKGFATAFWSKGWGFASAPEYGNNLLDGRMIRGEQTEGFRGYITDVCFDEAMRWMTSQKAAGKPFFCYLPLHAAHGPHIVPARYQEPFAGQKAPGFFGMLANIDENMGRLEAFLGSAGLRDDTILLFMTDNGGTAGVPVFNAGLRGAKVSYWDGGHRVPCFVRWPAGGLRPAGDLPQLTQAQDILPTLLAFAEVPRLPGPAFDGIDLSALLRGRTEHLPERTLFVQYGPGAGQRNTSGPEKFSAAIMRDRWRLLEGTKLYDVVADRHQDKDVAAAHPEVVASLRADYEAWWRQVSPRLDEFVPLSLGAPRQPTVELSSSDWEGLYVDNSGHINAAAGGPRGGAFNVVVEQAGEYEFVLSRWPERMDLALGAAPAAIPAAKTLPIAAARLTIAGQEVRAPCDPTAPTVSLRATLPAGRTRLQAWFQDKDGQDLAGADYLRVSLR